MDPAIKSLKLEYRYILIITVSVVGTLLIAGSITRLTGVIIDPVIDKKLFSATARIILLLFLIWCIKSWRLYRFNGFNTFNNAELRLLFFPVLILSFGMVSNWELYSDAEPYIISTFAISVITIGLLEEVLCRGIVLPLIIKSRIRRRNNILYALILSSAFFGILHYINFITQGSSFWDVTSQVLFAFALGMYLGALFLRTGNILVPVVVHAFINFIFGTGILREGGTRNLVEETADFWSIIPTLIVFALIAYSGYYMLKRVDREQVLEKVRAIRIRD